VAFRPPFAHAQHLPRHGANGAARDERRLTGFRGPSGICFFWQTNPSFTIVPTMIPLRDSLRCPLLNITHPPFLPPLGKPLQPLLNRAALVSPCLDRHDKGNDRDRDEASRERGERLAEGPTASRAHKSMAPRALWLTVQQKSRRAPERRQCRAPRGRTQLFRTSSAGAQAGAIRANPPSQLTQAPPQLAWIQSIASSRGNHCKSSQRQRPLRATDVGEYLGHSRASDHKPLSDDNGLLDFAQLADPD